MTMDSHYHDTLVTALIETIATWTDADKDRLASMLGAHCWPGGILDRKDPGGAEPLRRWRPGGPVPAMPACGCVRGRCTICN
jgi:hypothetical protein